MTLRNEFFAWKWGLERSAAKTTLSKARKEMSKPFDVDALTAEIEKGIGEVFDLLMPFEEFPIYTSFSGLVSTPE